MQNSSDNQFNITITNYSYFTVFSFNSTASIFSTSGLDIPWAFVGINVFNESNPGQSIGFDIEVTNSDASVVYTNTSCTNTLLISFEDIPYGDDTIFIITNDTGYYQRIYYKDILLNNFYNFSFYLPPLSTHVANTSDETILCLISVVDEIDQALPNCDMVISRLINTSNEYETISELMTDANGQVTVWFVPDENYKFDITLEGYTQSGSRYWTPTELLYTKTFMLVQATVYNESYVISDEIHIEGYIQNDNGTYTLFANYTDDLNFTINVTFYIYELDHATGLTSLVVSCLNITNIAQCSSVINVSNSHDVYIHVNHSIFGYNIFTLSFVGSYQPLTSEEEFDDVFYQMLGWNPFGWSNFIMFLLVVIAFFRADREELGMNLLLIGFMFLVVSYFVGFNQWFITYAGGIIPGLVCACGILIMWDDHRKKSIGGIR